MSNMNNIKKNVLRILASSEQLKPLGRWNIEYCKDKMNAKIDLSNEDHCGPCGQYSISKIPKSSEKIYTISPFKVSHIDFLIHDELKNEELLK